MRELVTQIGAGLREFHALDVRPRDQQFLTQGAHVGRAQLVRGRSLLSFEGVVVVTHGVAGSWKVVDEYCLVVLRGPRHQVSPWRTSIERVAVLLELGDRAVEDVRGIEQAGARANGAKHGNQRVRNRDPRKRLPPVGIPERDRDQHRERDERHHGEHHGGKTEEQYADQPLLFLRELDADQFQASFEYGEHGS